MDVMTINGTSLVCYSIGTVTVHRETGDFAEVDILIVWEMPLGYNLLIGIDTIALGGVKTMSAGSILLCGGQESCTSISIEEPHLCHI